MIVVAVIFFVIYRYFMKPRQRAAQQQRDTLIALEPGDEVLTGAGIFGTVQHIQGDRVTFWTGTGSTITVLRRTIARKLEDEERRSDDSETTSTRVGRADDSRLTTIHWERRRIRLPDDGTAARCEGPRRRRQAREPRACGHLRD